MDHVWVEAWTNLHKENEGAQINVLRLWKDCEDGEYRAIRWQDLGKEVGWRPINRHVLDENTKGECNWKWKDLCLPAVTEPVRYWWHIPGWLEKQYHISWIRTATLTLICSRVSFTSIPQLCFGMDLLSLRHPDVRTPHPRSIPVKHPPSIYLLSSSLIKVSMCRNPLRLIYLIRFVLFPQSKPHGTLLPPVIKGSKSGAGPV